MRCRNEDVRREICERQMDRRLKANLGWREQTRKSKELGLRPREGGLYECIERCWTGFEYNLDRKISNNMAKALRKCVFKDTGEM